MYLTVFKKDYTHSITFDDIFKGTNEIKKYRETYTRNLPESALDYGKVRKKDYNFNKNIEDFSYNTFRIPKHSGGFRKISEPNPELKQEQYKFLNMFETLCPAVHDCAFAYVKQRECLDAARRHRDAGAKWYLKLDFKHFFDMCNTDFVVDSLRKLFPLNNKDIFTEEDEAWFRKVCFLDNALPQGAPTSPKLCNLIMIPIDKQIATKLKRLGPYTYTRYADDVIISSPYDFDYNKIIADIINPAIAQTPLRLNLQKTRYGSIAGRNWNLGLMTNKDNNITVGYKRKRYLKIALHNFEMDYDGGNRWELQDLYHLQGEISYIKHIEPAYIKNLLDNKHPQLYNKLTQSIKEWVS